MGKLITDMLEERLKLSGRNYKIYDTNDFIPSGINDLPQDGTIIGIADYTEKNRIELINNYNITYSATLEFFVPATMMDLFQQDLELLAELEKPETTIDGVVKMIFPISSRFKGQAVNGQYFQSFTLSGEIFEYEGLAFGDDIELYFQLTESECVPPTSDPNDYVDQVVTADDGSVWQAENNIYQWEHYDEEIDNPTYVANEVSQLPPPRFGDTAEVLGNLFWDEIFKTPATSGVYIKATLEDLGTPQTVGINAVTTGFNMIDSDYIEWQTGYEKIWVEKPLTSPFDHIINQNAFNTLPTPNFPIPVFSGEKVQFKLMNLYDEGYITNSSPYNVEYFHSGTLNDLRSINAIGEYIMILGYTMIESDFGTYSSVGLKINLTTPSNPGINDIWYAFKTQENQYFDDLSEAYAYGMAIRVDDGSGYSYYTIVPNTGLENRLVEIMGYQERTFEVEIGNTKPRVTVTVPESPSGVNITDVWMALQTQQSAIFDDLQTFYANGGVIRTDDGFGNSYFKLQFVNANGNKYYMVLAGSAEYYIAELRATWVFINAGVGALIDIEMYDTAKSYVTQTENIYNTNGDIENEMVGYSLSSTTLQFKKLYDPTSVFDNEILKAYHSRKKPRPFTIKTKYMGNVFGISPLEYTRDFYVTNISINRTKRQILSFNVSLKAGDIV